MTNTQDTLAQACSLSAQHGQLTDDVLPGAARWSCGRLQLAGLALTGADLGGFTAQMTPLTPRTTRWFTCLVVVAEETAPLAQRLQSVRQLLLSVLSVAAVKVSPVDEALDGGSPLNHLLRRWWEVQQQLSLRDGLRRCGW